MINIQLSYLDLTNCTVKERFTTYAELERRMLSLRERLTGRQVAFSVDLGNEKSESLTVGLGWGDDEWTLAYWPAGYPEHHRDPVLYSLGNEHAQGHVTFFIGQHTRITRKYLVHRDHALAAVRSWIEHGALGDAVCWTDEIILPD